MERKMNMPTKKIVLLLGILILTALFALTVSDCLGEGLEIYDKTLRLHVLANSDSAEDQALKLKVRDKVLECLSDDLSDCNTKEEAVAVVDGMKEKIKKAASEVISDEGKSYNVELTVTEEYYPERAYEGISLPAGRYTSVRVLLGEAEGQNWWCVLFPQVCTDTATPVDEKLTEVGFSANQIKLLTKQEEPEYRIRFKIVELLAALIGR